MKKQELMTERANALHTIKETISNCINFMQEKAMIAGDIQSIFNIPFEDLGRYINDPDPHKASIIKALLQGKSQDEIMNDPHILIPILWDEEFSYEDYKTLGGFDAELHLCAHLLNHYGESKEAQRALQWIYSD